MSRLMRSPVLTLVIGALACCASCASTKELETRSLPFHVAILPMQEATIGRVSDGELPGKPTDLRLELDEALVTEQISDALAEYCFSEVTILSLDGLESVDGFGRERALLDQAKSLGADLVVDLDLRYDAEVYRKNSSTFWLNFPLFFFFSPSNWFVGDQSYFADVELVTSVYDLHGIEAGSFAVGDAGGRVVSASSRFSGSEVDFWNRSTGLKDYATSILIPSGFLARESENANAAIEKRVIEELREQVVQGLQSRSGELVQADWIAPVFILPEDVRVSSEGDDVLVSGIVRLREGALAERVEELVLDAGGELVRVRPDRTEGDSEELQAWAFEASVPRGEEAECLKLRCEAGSRDRYVRSYTFALPAAR